MRYIRGMHSPPDPVLASVIGAIVPASAAHGRQAAAQALRAAPPGRPPMQQAGERELLVHLAERVGAARHTAQPHVDRKQVLICAADHGLVHRLPLAGARSASAATAAEVAAGMAAVNVAARSAGATLTVVDCGVRGGVNAPGVVDVRIGDGTADIRQGPAMSMNEALCCLHTGIALLLSLADEGVDCLALGHIAPGSQPVSEALIAALVPQDSDALTALATRGGYDIGVMAGLILAAAAMRVPVVLDDHGTSAAALVAARLAPAIIGYLIAVHAGQSAIHGQALAMLRLDVPLGDLGLGQGEGMGACLILPMLDAAARLLADDATGPAPVPTHIFVYGTLRTGQPAHPLIAPLVRSSMPATVRGRLAALPAGYPGLFEDSASPHAVVAGELLELADPTAALAALDAYEGDEYDRLCCEATAAAGRSITAWCYVLRQAPRPGHAQIIDDGDWIAYVHARHAQKK